MGIGKKVFVGAACAIVAVACAIVIPRVAAAATAKSYYVQVSGQGVESEVPEAGECYYTYTLAAADATGSTTQVEVQSMLGNGPFRDGAWLCVQVQQDGTVRSFSEVDKAEVPAPALSALGA